VKNPKILVTGANGIVGRVLLRELSHHNIVGIARTDADLSSFDQFSRIVDQHLPCILVHCAARGGRQPIGVFNSNDLINNLQVVENIARLSHRFDRIINIGSGAEYGLDNPIIDAKESWLNNGRYPLPSDSYGLSKRLSWKEFENIGSAINIRIFGCFDPSEPDFRLLRRFINWKTRSDGEFKLKNDRLFSWISGQDLASVMDHVITLGDGSWNALPKTINVAYPETSSMMLSHVINRWCYLHGINPEYNIDAEKGIPYTCNTDLMQDTIRITFKGLDACLKEYT
jgi:nucleoside-diphosphate-sugar epimerase